MDRRILKTRKAILIAFNNLLSKKSYSKITIQDIIDEANIGRSTFYTHFETKDFLLKEVCDELFSHIFSENLNSEDTHDFSLKPNNMKNRIIHILHHLKDNNKYIKGILLSDSNEIFIHYFNNYIIKLLQRDINFNNDKENTTISKKFLFNHITGSFFIMIKCWFENNLKEKPEELADYYIKIISPVLTFL